MAKNLNNDDVKRILKSELDKYIKNSLDDEMNSILKKGNSKTRSEMIRTIKDSLEAVYKILWVKRDFWKSDIR